MTCLRFLTLAVGIIAVTDVSSASFELAEEEKTPYDYVQDRLDSLQTDTDTGLPISNSYEVEENEDYPEEFEVASSNVYSAFGGGLGGFGGHFGQLGYNNLGLHTGLGQGTGLVAGGPAVGGLHGVGLGGGVGVGGIGLGGGHVGLGGGHLGFGGGHLGLGGVGVAGPGVGLGGGHLGLGGVGVGGAGVGLVNSGLGGGIQGGHGGGLIYQPFYNLHGTQIGGGYVNNKAYEAAQKKAGDENIEKIAKKAEEESKGGEEGFQQGSVNAIAAKGDSGFYKDEEAKKKAAEDEKYYEGAQKFDKNGANEQVQKTAKGHKKGHSSKGFKSSSSKNEEEKTETFYDEAHDEADAKLFGQNKGSFGENAASGFKGVAEEKILDAKKEGKEGHHISEHKVDDSKANKGGYAQNAYKGGLEQLEKFNNLGAHSVHGHQESAGEFQQNKPYGILPIHAK